MSRKRLLAILGNLTAFGPFVTDFYLPCLPRMTRDFIVTPSLMQVSLTAGMVGLAVGQLLIGPISDKLGRRGPLLWCLALFTLSTVGCVLAPDIAVFIALRLVQGMAGSSGLVISKAIISDSLKGPEMARSFAIMASVQGVAPVLAPVIGGVTFSLTCWQGTFVALAAWGLALLCACIGIKETLPRENRLGLPILKSFGRYGRILGNGPYLAMNLLLGFATAGLMAYVSSSPFIFQEHFGLSPMLYSICFACNAVALVLGSVAVLRIRRLPIAAEMSAIGLLSSSVFTAVALLFDMHFLVFEVVLFMFLFSVGMVTPVSMSLALGSVSENRGMASGLLGALPYILGGIVAPLTGMGNMLHSVPAIMLATGVSCMGTYLVSRRWEYPS